MAESAPLVITAGEPAGIGPELCLALATKPGVPDFVVGAPDYDAGVAGTLADAGRGRAVCGATGAFLWSVEGPFVYMKGGLSVSRVQDISGDGIDDVVIGMPYMPP